MNFLELQTEVKDLLNFNSGQTDQDFTTTQVKNAINRAYDREIVRARQHAMKAYFQKTDTLSWPASQLTMPLPANLKYKDLIRITDTTNADPGYELVFDDTAQTADVFWKDSNTLQWGSAGPSQAKTLRFEYIASAVKMVADIDEPLLLPPEFHELLVWSAAIDLRRRADEASPGEWQAAYKELQTDLWKHVMRGRPHQNVATITPHVILGETLY